MRADLDRIFEERDAERRRALYRLLQLAYGGGWLQPGDPASVPASTYSIAAVWATATPTHM